MPLFCLRSASPLRALALFLGMGLTAAASFAADEAASGTFNAPTYAPAAAASAAAGNGQQTLNPQRGAAGLAGQRGTDPLQRRNELVPVKPNEFQKFVETATGRQLPLFGASFFVDAANSFSTVDNVPVSSDYTVGPGDEVMIRAWGGIDIDYRATVDRNGQVNLPKVGSFTVAGVKAWNWKGTCARRSGGSIPTST